MRKPEHPGPGAPAPVYFGAEELLAALLASSDDAIVALTLDGVITRWSAGAEYLYGYSSHEAIGQAMHLLLPEGRASEEERLLESIRHGQGVKLYDTQRVCRDGQIVDVAVTVTPVRNSHGRIIAACSIARRRSGRASST